MTAGNEHSPLLVEEKESERRTPLRYALRFAGAAAAFAVVATVGVVAVHPNGSPLVVRSAMLGQEEALGPISAISEVDPPTTTPSMVVPEAPANDADGDPYAGAGPAEPGDSANAHAQAKAAAVQDPAPAVENNSPAGGIAGGFAAIVSETKTKPAVVAEATSYIEDEGAQQDLEDNVHALATADDRLKAATAEKEKAEAVLRQKQIEEDEAKADLDEYTKAASNGGLSDTAQDLAKQNTAALAADKRVYLNTRNTYAESTALVAKNRDLLQRAKQASAAAMQAYVEKKNAADAARAKAEEMAAQMINHNSETKSAPEVGEEMTPEGIARSQTMAEISAAATQQDILANDIQTAASLLKQAWDDRLLEQKTAQETLDAEIARNADLAKQSNKEQKDFIDSSHVAAIDATNAADAKKKAESEVSAAAKRYADAQTAKEAAAKEKKRLEEVETVRKQEFAAQSAKTDSVKAKTAVMDAILEESQIASKTEHIKDEVNRDAVVNTIATDLENKENAAEAAAAAANEASARADANKISQAAIDQPVPTVVKAVLKSNPVTDEAVVEAAQSEAVAEGPSASVAATGAKAQAMAKAQAAAKAKQMAEAAKRSAAAAKKARQSAKKTA